MHKPFISCAISAMFTWSAIAQPSSVEKNKVLEYFQEQQFDEAIAYLQPVVATDSANQQALRFLGYAYYMSENVKAAEQCYRKMVETDSNDLTANHYLATIYNNREPEKAMQHIFRLIQLQPTKAMYYRNMGELLQRKNYPDSALLYLTHAYDLVPGDPRNLASFADLLIYRKEYGRADSLLEVGLTRDSLNAAFLKLRIKSAYDNKDYEAVPLPGERLMRLADITISALNKVALAYYNLQRYQDCIRVCEYMSGMGLESEAINYYQAKAWAKLKDFAKSNAFLETCLRMAISNNAEMYYYAMGENLEGLKQFKKAAAAYDTAFYLFKSPLALYSCGRIYEVELKNPTLARQYYTRYLALAQPIAPDEKKAYAYVKERWGRKKPKK